MTQSTVKMNLTINDRASDVLAKFKVALGDLQKNIGSVSGEIEKLSTSFNNLARTSKEAAGGVQAASSAIQGVNKSAKSAADSLDKYASSSLKAANDTKQLQDNTNGLSNVFSRIGFAVDRLAIEMGNLRTSMNGVGTQFRSVLTQANSAGNGLTAHSNHVRQLTQDYNEMSRAMVGAVQMWAANKLGAGFKAAGSAEMDSEYQQARIDNIGFSGSQKSQINSKAIELGSDKQISLSNKELVPVLTDLMVEMRGDNGKFNEFASVTAKFIQAQESIYRSKGMNYSEIDKAKDIKTLDKLGAFENLQKFLEYADSITQRRNMYGPDSQSADKLSQEAAQLKTLRATLSAEGYKKLGAVLDMARNAGVDARSLYQISNEAYGNKTTQKEAEARADYGFIPQENIKRTTANNVDLQKSNLRMTGSDLLATDPFKFVEELLIPAMKKKGVNTNDMAAVKAEVSKLWNDANQQDVIMLIISRIKELKAEWQQLDRAAKTEQTNNRNSQTTGFGWEQAKSSISDFAKTIGTIIEPAIKMINDAITSLFDGMSKFAKENPITASLMTIVAAGTMVIAFIGGVVTWFGGWTAVAARLGLTLTATGGAAAGFGSIVVAAISSVVSKFAVLAGAFTILKLGSDLVNALSGDFSVGFERIITAISGFALGVAIFAKGCAAMGGIATITLTTLIKGFARAFGIVGVILLMADALNNFKIGGTSLLEYAFMITEMIVDAFDNAFSSLGKMAMKSFAFLTNSASDAVGAFGKGLEMAGATDQAAKVNMFADSLRNLAAARHNAADSFKDDFLARSTERKNRALSALKVNAQNAGGDKASEYSNEMKGVVSENNAQIQKLQNEVLNNQNNKGQLNRQSTATGGGGGRSAGGIRDDQRESKFMEAELKELKALYEQGKIDAEEYFTKRVEITNAGIDKEIAALQKQKAAAKNAKQADAIQNKIDVLERQRQANLAGIQTEKEKELHQIEEKRLSIKEKLAQLTGKTAEVELTKIEKEIAQLRQSMGANLTDEDEAMLRKIESIMKAKAAYNELMTTVKEYESTADLAHKKAASAAKLGEITATEAARRSEEAYRAEGEAIEALIPKLEELAQRSANPEMIKQVEELKIKSHELANQVGEDAKRMKEDIGGAFDGLFNDLSSGKGIKAALNNFANNIVQTINKVLNKQMSETITNMLFGQEKNGSFTGGMGNFLQGIISPKGFNGGGSGGLGGLFGNMFGGSSGDGEQGGTAGSFAELGKAASMAMNGLTNMTTNGVTGATTALGENIAKTVMGTTVEMTATAALQQLAVAASSAAAALSSMGGGSGGGLLGNLFGGSPAASSGGGVGFFESVGKTVGGIFGGFPSYDVGTDFVPKDMYALIHQGEAILPATAAEKFRQFVDNGGGQSSTPTIVNNNFTVNGSTTLQSQQQIAKLAADSLNRATRRNG